MYDEAGFRGVVVGGRLKIGSMQAVAGARGALAYNIDKPDNDMRTATDYNSSVAHELPNSHVTEDLRFGVTSAEFNLRDQIRKGASQ